MNAQKVNTLLYPLAVVVMLVGIGFIYYGFELVSIPHIKEYHETTWILMGAVMLLAGFLIVALKLLKGPQVHQTGDQGQPVDLPDSSRTS